MLSLKKGIKMNRFLFTILCACSTFYINTVSIEHHIKNKTNMDETITVSLNLDSTESVFTKSLHISTDHPDITIKSIDIPTKSEDRYLPEFKQTHEMYNEPVTINVTAQTINNAAQSLDQNLYINFQTYPELNMEEEIITVSLASEKTIKATKLSAENTNTQSVSGSGQSSNSASFLSSIQDMAQNTDSLWLRLLLTFLLGLLFSLTPCIYPMIPITIGILHQSGKKSLLYNFFGSFCYAAGLSTTFAILGLLAAFAGASFGAALANPFFVAFIVLFLGYMSLTMIGVIDMYTPSFMKGGAQMNTKLGPFLSAFFFGLISGTIASPCVSPGLFTLLTIVATIGSYFIGFILLFMFGMGMSTPLMCIATFSNSLSVLPQSGMWMVEIKKLLGFVMFMMCFYYLNNVVPFGILIWFIMLYVLAVALYYIISAQSSAQYRTMKSFIGVALLATSVFLGLKVYETNFTTKSAKNEVVTPWVDSYDDALAQAQQESKAVLIDFTANYCSVCKAIEYKVFKNQEFIDGINDTVVLHKVDCAQKDETTQKLQEKYGVKTLPRIFLINPNTEEVLQQWTSEPYSSPIETFIQEINNSITK